VNGAKKNSSQHGLTGLTKKWKSLKKKAGYSPPFCT
jgi:hypothetical protein